MAKRKQSKTLEPVGETLIGQRKVPFASYEVQGGDTVYSLWIKFRDKTTTGAIKAANGITTNTLPQGTSIKVPLVL